MISKAAFARIVKAAKPHRPGPLAHKALEQAAADFKGLRLHPEHLRKSAERDKQRRAVMTDAAKKFRAAIDALTKMQVEVSHPPLGGFSTPLRAVLTWTERDIGRLDLLNGIRARGDTASAWRWHELCGIWIEHFGGDLGISRPKDHEARGPLARFLSAVLVEVFAEPRPSPHTINSAVRRVQKDRAHPARRRAERE